MPGTVLSTWDGVLNNMDIVLLSDGLSLGDDAYLMCRHSFSYFSEKHYFAPTNETPVSILDISSNAWWYLVLYTVRWCIFIQCPT